MTDYLVLHNGNIKKMTKKYLRELGSKEFTLINLCKYMYDIFNSVYTKRKIQLKVRGFIRRCDLFYKIRKVGYEYVWMMQKKEFQWNYEVEPQDYILHINSVEHRQMLAESQNVTYTHQPEMHHMYKTKLETFFVENIHSFRSSNMYDFNRNMGDYLRFYMNLQEAYESQKITSLLQVDDNVIENRIKANIFPKRFMYGNVDYLYTNNLLFSKIEPYATSLFVINDNKSGR